MIMIVSPLLWQAAASSLLAAMGNMCCGGGGGGNGGVDRDGTAPSSTKKRSSANAEFPFSESSPGESVMSLSKYPIITLANFRTK